MRKLSALLVFTLIAPSIASAKGNHTMAGCGIGYVLFAHNDNSKKTQIISNLINTFIFTPTWGMTSGTTGCTEDGAPKWVRAADVFAEANFDSLKREMAIGQGEYVSTFASLLGVSETKVGELVSLMKDQYTSLLPSAGTTHTELMQNVSGLLDTHPELLS